MKLGKDDNSMRVTLNDSLWYTGTNLGYKLDCGSCNESLEIVNNLNLATSDIGLLSHVKDTFTDSGT